MAEKRKKVLNVPTLRFKGFEGEWDCIAFEEIATNKSEKYNPANELKSIRCVELEHLASENGRLLGFIDGSQSGSIKNVFKKGDVLFGKLRPYLRKYLLADFDGVCSSEIWVLRGKGITNNFLYWLVQTEKFIELANLSSGSKMPRADWEVISKAFFFTPSISEQEKITNFLSLLEKRIQTQNKIIEKLESLIKALADHLIERETTKSKSVELGEIGTSYNGLTGKTKDNFGSGERYIQYKQVFDNSRINIKSFDFVEIGFDESQNEVLFGDVLFTISSETPNEIGMSSVMLDKIESVYLNSFCFGFRPNDFSIISPYFLRFYFRSSIFRNEIQKLAQGSTRYNMSKTAFLKLRIQIPDIGEQTKIADALSATDDKLETEKEYLNLLVNQKSWLAKKLFR